MWIAVFGDIVEGFRFVGPFATYTEIELAYPEACYSAEGPKFVELRQPDSRKSSVTWPRDSAED